MAGELIRLYNNPLSIFGENRLPKILIAAFVCVALLMYALLATPLHDDGINGNFGVPFYSDYFDLYHSFFKPIVALLIPVTYLPYPWSFAAASLVHILMMAAAAYLTFLFASRYVSREVATLASFIAMYALFTHETFMSTRPEVLLLVLTLAIAYLCDTWRLTGQTRYLLIVAILAGALALPSHPNASIAYAYIALFSLWQWRSLAIRDWAVLTATFLGSSLLGMVIILLPDPSALIELYTEYSSGGSHRFTFLIGEIRRFTFFLRPYPLLPIVLFFGAMGLTALVTRTIMNSTPPPIIRS